MNRKLFVKMRDFLSVFMVLLLDQIDGSMHFFSLAAVGEAADISFTAANSRVVDNIINAAIKTNYP